MNALASGSAGVRRNVEAVAAALRQIYGDYSHKNKRDPFNELLFILCSVRTDESKYLSSYLSLRRAFPTRAALCCARMSELIVPLRRGGLARQKAIAIKGVLREIVARFGRPSLRELHGLTDEECERFLTSLPYVGKKVARCVMMCALQRQVFPVDTHCWRIAQRMGWVRASRKDGTCSQRDMDRLQDKIPPRLRFSLHVNLLSLGRDYCRAHRPRCAVCPVAAKCKQIGARSSDLG
jgi:endonuclease III